MTKRFPYLKTSGTHYEVGYAIGRFMAKQIQKVIKRRRQTITHYENLLTQINPFLKATKIYFPLHIKEAEGIAAGAGVPFSDYFLVNNREVYDESQSWSLPQEGVPDHCTIAVSFNRDGAIVGHNEDWSSEAIDQLYVLRATINKTTFLGLNYATAIPGVSATLNNWGLVQCINDLHHKHQVGVPKNFLARAVLECQSLDEAEKLLRDTPQASGFNHVLIQDSQIRNIEIADSDMDVEKIKQETYVHTNHYLSKHMQKYEKFRTKSSEARYERARQLVKMNMTKTEMIALLSDTKNSEYPICRAQETIGSLIIIPAQKEVDICYGHPCAGEFVRYTL